MNRQLSLAKISIPRLPAVTPRSRLLERMKQGQDHALVWICGPAGAGKTTLVASFIKANNLPCLWYQLDKGDGDLGSFFQHMSLAAHRMAYRRRKPMTAFGPEYTADCHAFARKYFRELFSRIKHPSVIVLDNYHALPDDTPLHEIFSQALEDLPLGSNFIAMSRSPPPASLSRCAATGRMMHIDWEALKLTPEECREVMTLRGCDSTAEAHQAIYKLTEGWAAGLSLIIEGMKQRSIDPRWQETLHGQMVFDFFAAEVLEGMDETRRTFLLYTALFPYLTAAMAEELTDYKDAKKILEELVQSHFFVERKSLARQAVYQYHALFRQFLLAQLTDFMTDETLRMLQGEAAAILEEAGCLRDAAELYIEARYWQPLSGLIERRAPQLLASGRGHTLGSWLQALPQAMRADHPWLAYWMGVCSLTAEPENALVHFEQAYQRFAAAGQVGVIDALAGAMESIIQQGCDLSRLDRWITRLAQLEEHHSGLSAHDAGDQSASSILLALVFRKPDYPRFDGWKARVEQALQGPGNPIGRAYAAHNLATHYLWSGDLKGAALMVETMRALIPPGKGGDGELSPLGLLFIHVGEAACHFLEARHEECIQTVTRGLETMKESGILMWEMHLKGFGAASALAHGNYPQARAYLKPMSRALGTLRQFDIAMYYMLRVWYHLDSGESGTGLVHARQHAGAGLRAAEQLGAVIPLFCQQYQLAQVAHAEGNIKEASQYLTLASDAAVRLCNPMMTFMCHLAMAQFALDRGEEEAGEAALRNAMTLGRRYDYINTWHWRPRIMAWLCAEALQRGIETTYVQHLVRRRNLVPDSPPLHVQNWPWPVRIYTLKRFALVRDGKQLHFTRKTPQKPLLLLKVLIAMGGRNVPRERVIDILWPDAEGDTAAKSLSVTLVRLRKLLGGESVLDTAAGQLTLNPACCWVDIWTFERGLSGKHRSDCATLEALRRTLALYHGPFLDGHTEPLIVEIQERLHGRFIMGIERIGHLCEQRCLWQDAIDHYQRGIEVDGLKEYFYQRTIFCLIRLDRSSEALAVYNRCQRVLAAHGLTPSKKTQELYHTIIS